MSDLAPVSIKPSMKMPWVVRTFQDFADRWDAIKGVVSAPAGCFGFVANVDFVDEAKFYGLSDAELVLALPRNYPFEFVFVAAGDYTQNGEEVLTLLWFRSVLAVVGSERSASLKDVETNLLKVRHSARLVQELENNLSVANVDIDDIFECISEDGLFQGFNP